MAKSSKRRKSVKVDDVERTFFVKSPSSTVGLMTVWIPDHLQRVNRRTYEQSRCYDFRFKPALDVGNVESNYSVFTLSNAWWVKAAIEYAKGVWLTTSREERKMLRETGGMAKYHDFIINTSSGAMGNYANSFQFAPDLSSGDNIVSEALVTDETLMEGQSTASGAEGDQVSSQDEYVFTLDNTDTTGTLRAYNIFEQYLLSLNITPESDTRDGPYKDLLAFDESQMANLQQDGDNPPWDADAFPSPWVLQDVITLDQTTSPASEWTRWISAPLGVVLIKERNNTAGEVNFHTSTGFLFEARKGLYRGVYAPAYRGKRLA